MAGQRTGDLPPALAEALEWVGTPYRHQGVVKGVGCDCLGLVRGVWRNLYGQALEDPGAYSADWAEMGARDRLLAAARRHFTEKDAAALRAGDLLVFRWRGTGVSKHLGIAAGPDSFVHAYEGMAVTVSALVPHWRRRISGVFAFPAVSRG